MDADKKKGKRNLRPSPLSAAPSALEQLTRQLAALEPLTEEQVGLAIAQLIEESVPTTIKADFLTHLARKGETADEIAAFARQLRIRAIQPTLEADLRAAEILDVVGTGGDRLGTFNISTAAALVASAAGVRVAKHGNRASTSRVGSADVIEALGIPYDLDPEQAVRSLQRHGFAFFFAPKYHPAFRYIIPARKLCAERGQGTIFNFLGPLLNPARPSAMLVGVSRPELCNPLARVLQTLGVRRAMVVCGSAPESATHPPASTVPPPQFLDELSTLGESTIAEFHQDLGFSVSVLSPTHFPLQPATLADLRGGDLDTNVNIIRRLLKGEERGPKRDAVLLNAAAALFVAGRVRSLAAGWDLAAAVIESGQAFDKLNELTG
ncbi:MAG TPA: anthranilate phosphoribosyltransferase [Candidatus Binatia bacterium]|nr:anthranilate phosphoribosyltransferase [Candidatus Binatia bacterium]